jgi:hypothetical protein
MYSIDASTRSKMITVTYSGVVDIAERTRAWEEVSTHVQASGLTRILLDFTAASVAIDDFHVSRGFASQLTRPGGALSCRIAYLSPPGAQVNIVFENLASARGLTFERFNERLKALTWLLSDRPDQAPLLTRQSRDDRGATPRWSASERLTR